MPQNSEPPSGADLAQPRRTAFRATHAALALVGGALLTSVSVQAQTVLDENFGAPVDGVCPTSLPAGWGQFKGNTLTRVSDQFTWPADDPGWAIFPLADWVFPTLSGSAVNCAPMSSGTYESMANDWLVSPSVTVPASAKLRYLGRGTDTYEVRFTSTNASVDAMLASSTVLLTASGHGDTPIQREIDLSSVAGQTGYIAFRNTATRGFIQIVDDVWLGALPLGEWGITPSVTPADGSGGELICPTGVLPGGVAHCTAVAKEGYTFHYGKGIEGCDQPGDTLHTNNDRCTMSNLQGPRTLYGTFVPNLPPPSNITATPDGAGGVLIGWTPPDSILPIYRYDVSLISIVSGVPTGVLGASCLENPSYPEHNLVTSCRVPGYQTGTVYGLNVFVTDGWAFSGHYADLTSRAVIQLATVNLPEGVATLRTLGEPPLQNDLNEPPDLAHMCLLSGAPAVLTPSATDLTAAGAPSGSNAPLGALQLEVKGCAGKTLQVAVDFPAGSLSGLQSWTQHGSGWQTEGSIQGDTIHYSFTVPSTDGPSGLMMKAAAPGDISVTLAPLALAGPGPGPGTGGVQPVPTLSQWSIVLLSALAGMLGWRRRR